MKKKSKVLLAISILGIFVGSVAYTDGWTKISSQQFYEYQIPANNPQSDSKISLGKKLFEEKRMSSTNKVSCATCHDQKMAFTDGKKVSEGISSLKGKRNAPTVINALFSNEQFWDGRAHFLEDQAKLPVLNAVEMGMKSGEDVVAKIDAIPEYKPLFKAAFGSEEVTYDKISMAISAFERTLISTPAPFDRFLAGDSKAISAAAKRGWSVFNGQGRCVTCHMVNTTTPLFSDFKFHNIGIAAHNFNFEKEAATALATVDAGNKEQVDNLAIESDLSDLGRFLVTKSRGDIGAFKTPTLRNIAATGPYMHDGSFATLWDVVDHYNKGGVSNQFLDGGITRLGLNEGQISDLVEFMGTLTSPEYAVYANKQMAKMKNLSRSSRPQRDTALALGQKGNASDSVFPQTDKDPSQVGNPN